MVTQAARIGSYGLQGVINDSHGFYAYDYSANGARHVSARFYFNPNSVNIPEGGSLYITTSERASDYKWFYCLQVGYVDGYYSLALCGYDDNGEWILFQPVALQNPWQAIEIEC